MIRTGMRGIIELIRKHPKIRRILRCESPYFHHCTGGDHSDGRLNSLDDSPIARRRLQPLQQLAALTLMTLEGMDWSQEEGAR